MFQYDGWQIEARMDILVSHDGKGREDQLVIDWSDVLTFTGAYFSCGDDLKCAQPSKSPRRPGPY
jgi:hypothetical protein